MPTSYSLLAEDVWRCILPYLSFTALHHLAHLDTHLQRTLSHTPIATTILTQCCHLRPHQLTAALSGASGQSAVAVMRRLVASAMGVEVMLSGGGGCGMGALHEAMLMHSVVCALAAGRTAAYDATPSRSAASTPGERSPSSSLTNTPPLLALTAPETPTCVAGEVQGEAAALLLTAPLTPPLPSTASAFSSSSPSTPSSSSSSATAASSLDSSHLSLLYFYHPNTTYPLPSPLRILSASSSPAGHFPFPHAYFALWLTSRWKDSVWVSEWVAARRREENVERMKRRRKKLLEQQYNLIKVGDPAKADKAEAKETTTSATPADQQPQPQQQAEDEDEPEWTADRHERVAAATLADLNHSIRWLGEFASPTHPHGEVFGFLTAPITKRTDHTRAGQQAGRDYEYAFTEGSCEGGGVGVAGGWERAPVVSWRVVSAPSRMRFAFTVWPCLYVYMRSLCAPGLIDGWAKRMGVERVALSECSIRGRMFLHMAAMDRWEAIQ